MVLRSRPPKNGALSKLPSLGKRRGAPKNVRFPFDGDNDLAARRDASADFVHGVVENKGAAYVV